MRGDMGLFNSSLLTRELDKKLKVVEYKGHTLKVYGEYLDKQPFLNREKVRLYARKGSTGCIAVEYVEKPYFLGKGSDRWIKKVQKATDHLISEAKKDIDKGLRKKRITNDLLESLRGGNN